MTLTGYIIQRLLGCIATNLTGEEAF